MRTTVNLHDGILQRARRHAARSGKTISAWIEDAIRARLDEPAPVSRKPFRLVTSGGTGLRPGFSIERLEHQVNDLEDAQKFKASKGRK